MQSKITRAEKKRQWYYENKERVNRQKLEWYNRNKQRVCQEQKNRYWKNVEVSRKKHRRISRKSKNKCKFNLVSQYGGKCCVCGYNRFAGALDFHHINHKTKLFRVSQAPNIKAAQKEAKKCVLLCSNCHRELHGGKITLPSHYNN